MTHTKVNGMASSDSDTRNSVSNPPKSFTPQPGTGDINPDWNKPSTVKGLNLSKLPTSESNMPPITPAKLLTRDQLRERIADGISVGGTCKHNEDA